MAKHLTASDRRRQERRAQAMTLLRNANHQADPQDCLFDTRAAYGVLSVEIPERGFLRGSLTRICRKLALPH